MLWEMAVGVLGINGECYLMKTIMNRKVIHAYSIAVKILVVCYALILLVVITSNFSVFKPNWPFGLVASFMSCLVFAFPFVLLGLFVFWRNAIPILALFALVAFYPFYTFDKMAMISQESCENLDCVSVMAANLRHNEIALQRLAKTDAKKSDVLIITEVPYETTESDLLALFPMDGRAEIGLLTETGLKLGSRLAIISRKPLKGLKMHLENFPVSKLRSRGLVEFDYVTKSGAEISFLALHSPPPKGRQFMASRDNYLKSANQLLTDKENFILIGDFNLTPWEPRFNDLRGQRAGDPRWKRTWNANNFYGRLTIDHAFIGADLALVEASVMEEVGSDHFPIKIIVHPKAN